MRAVGENGLTTELEDLAYKLSITSNGTAVYSADLTGTQTPYPKMHNVLSRWTREFWIGGTPQVKVNIDNNLAYLESTRFLPNFDTSIVIPQTSIAAEYSLWAGKPNHIYDGDCDGQRESMGVRDGRRRGAYYLAPYPQWAALWLYTGDWRMRQMSLGMADLAGAYPGQFARKRPDLAIVARRSDRPKPGNGARPRGLDRRSQDPPHSRVL